MDYLENNTYQEILSQPDVWIKTLQLLNENSFGKLLDAKSFDQVIVSGCGSTYYLSIWGARLMQERSGLPCRPLPGSELWLNHDLFIDNNKRTLLIAISRSGTTSETIFALEKFKKQGNGMSIVVTCYPESALAKLADKVVSVPHAQEKSIAQTRSFSNMMLGISSLVDDKTSEELQEKLAARQRKLFEDYRESAIELARDKSMTRVFFLGQGAKYGLACEAMLKMKEMSLTYAEAYHTLEFRHGPMSMVNKNSIVIGLLGGSDTQSELKVLSEMKKLGGKVWALGNIDDASVPDWLDLFIPINTDDLGAYGDVLYLPLLQTFACERSLAKGYNPDKPNNLTAVVTLDGSNE